MCHSLLNDPSFFTLLLHIDRELAQAHQVRGCPCGGVLHQAHFPRKPRGCPRQAREDCSVRFSFCCHRCRARHTAPSVRFLGRRAYVALAVVLLCGRQRRRQAQIKAGRELHVSERTLARWRHWWHHLFVQTPLWHTVRAHLLPPIKPGQLPAALLARFPGDRQQKILRLLLLVSPLSVPD